MYTMLELDIGRIYIKHIDNHSDRSTIVFLHDSLGCIEMWRNFPDKLGELIECNVLVYDRFGHGKSQPFIDSRRGKRDYLEKEADILVKNSR